MSSDLRLAIATACACAAMLALACGPSPSASRPPESSSAGSFASAPLSMEVNLDSGSAEVELEGAYAPLSAPTKNATALRSSGRGAVVRLGPAGRPRATLWLRGTTTARIGQTGSGALVLDVVRGQARIRVHDAELDVVSPRAGGFAPLGMSDALIERRGSLSSIAATAARPERAGWSIALEAPQEPAGFGRLIVGSGDDAAPLALRKVAISVRTEGGLAVTEVEHRFYSSADETIEGTFRFPVPSGAMVQGLAMEINGRLMEGEIVEKEKARKVYESIVDRMLDPALLEWEQGQWFKLRVFPIEPQQEKRVVLRYATPLVRTLEGWEYVYEVSAPDRSESVGALTLTFNGETITDTTDLAAGQHIAVALPDSAVPEVTRELRADGIYTAVRLRPDFRRAKAPRPTAARRVVILVDTSRSALEARELSARTLAAVSAELSPRDLLWVGAVDVTTRFHADEPAAATANEIARARDFVNAITPDGASDLGAALERAAEARPTHVIYIGDGTPTWGTTDGQELIAAASRHLGGASVSAALLGRGANTELWAPLTGGLGGLLATPRTAVQAEQFALAMAPTAPPRRIHGAVAEAEQGHVLFPRHPRTVTDGEQMIVVMRTEPGTEPPNAITLRGETGGERFEQIIPVGDAAPARFVSQRWALRQMAALAAEGGHKEQIVELSVNHGVLSRHTSLLVLESEEAYREHNIERRRAAEALVARADGAPQVTGADLSNVDGRSPTLGPDVIQPGDPEITIPAPRDARTVTVVFPFGDTKIAEWDDATGAWMVRFLIDRETPDGKYLVAVAVRHADGSVERFKLPYFVDTVPPAMEFEVTRTERGYRFIARQQRRRGELVPYDARRVEIALPGGEVLTLAHTGRGEFTGEWTPPEGVAMPLTITAITTDRALNQVQHTVTLPAVAP